MQTIFIERDQAARDELFVMIDDGTRQRVLSGPWSPQVAHRQAENAARRQAEKTNAEAIWTVKPDDVAQRERARGIDNGSRSAWIVR